MSKYKIGNIVEGSVTGIEKYGIFVGLDNYYSGLIHISEISRSFVKNINSYVKLGDTIRVKVVGVDDDSCHVNLSIKDIDYHIKEDKNGMIEEVGSGFGVLRDNLDEWINIKINEMNTNICEKK